jgi:diketogulonate reductase-like aldo/keto reductase
MEAAPIPPLLYGTAWKEERTQALTAQALAAGVVGIDTANQRKHYFEAAVGQAVKQAIAGGKASRSSLFLQTKYTFRGGQDHRLPYDARAPIATQVVQSFESSLEHFETDYLDSYVLHGPMTRDGLTPNDVEAWRAIESLARAGRTRFIGVSNVTASQLEALWQLAQVKPRFVQNRCYASAGWDRSVRDVCRARDITYQGFSLLTANRGELALPSMTALAARKRCTAAELVFAFARATSMVPLTGTSSAEHLAADLRALELTLDSDEIRLIETLRA